MVLAELDELAQSLAERIGRAVAIDDPTLRLLVHTPHHGHVDEVRMQSIMNLRAQPEVVDWVLSTVKDAEGPLIRLPAQERWHMMERVCLPLRDRGHVLGYLWITTGGDDLSERDIAVVTEAGRAAARLMAQGGMPRPTTQVWERSLAQDLLSSDEDVRLAAARSLREISGIGGPVRAVVVHPPSRLAFGAEQVADLDRDLDRSCRSILEGPALTVVVDRRVVILVPADGRAVQRIDKFVSSARRSCQRAVRAKDVLVGIGSVVSSPQDFAASYQQAVDTVRVLEAVPWFGTQAEWSQLGFYRFVCRLEDVGVLATLVAEPVFRLAEDPAARDILESVEAYLDHSGDVRTTVDDLSIHRTSLYYRLRRFRELCGMDLRDGDARLCLHVAFKLARMHGWTPGQPLPK